MRSTEWRSLPSARSRDARPLSTQSTMTGTIVSRNDRRVGGLHEVGLRPAAVLVHAHEPGDLARELLARATLAQAGPDHVRAAVLVPAVVLLRVPARRAESQPAALSG